MRRRIQFPTLFFLVFIIHKASCAAPTKYVCPDDITIGWLPVPPYIMEMNGTEQKGFLATIMENAFTSCCRNNVSFQYVTRASEYGILVDLTLNSSLDLIIPIRTNLNKDRFLTFPYVEIAQSPGAVLYDIQKNKAQHAVKNTVLANIPLVGLLIVWVSIFGVSFWILEIIPSKAGRERSIKEMIYEILEGIWWSFITLATVGYGDILPSRIGSRILCFIWLLFSSVTIALYTATVTSILIKECFSASLEIKGSKIGVMKGSNEHRIVLKKNGLPMIYSNIEDLIYNGFHDQEMQGGLIELYQASHYSKAFENYRIQTVIEDVKSVGIVLRTRIVKLQKCLNQNIVDSQREIYEMMRNKFPPLKTNFANAVSEETSQSLLVPSANQMKIAVIAVASTILILCFIGIAREKLFLSKKYEDSMEHFSLLHEIKGTYHKDLRVTMENLRDDISGLEGKLYTIMEGMDFRMNNANPMFPAREHSHTMTSFNSIRSNQSKLILEKHTL